MEKFGVAFTGADSKFFDPSRQEMKAYAKKANVPAPNWVMVDRVEDVERVAKATALPCPRQAAAWICQRRHHTRLTL